MKGLSLAVLSMMLILLSGCGDSSSGEDASGGTCAPVAACGGDLEGVWIATSTCGLSQTITNIDDCEGSSQTLDVSATGTLSFNADGTFVRDLKQTFEVSLSIPKMCVTGGACDSVDPGCTDDGAACVCADGGDEEDQGEGSYVVNNDNTFTTTENAGTDEEDNDTLSYCVRGSTLYLLFEARDEDSQDQTIMFRRQ